MRRLPHRLVEAFKATLEEALVADFLVHVLDGSSTGVESHLKTTLEVLGELDADDKPRLTVFNKMDLVNDPAVRRHLTQLAPDALFVSSHSGEGLEDLLIRLDDSLRRTPVLAELLVPYDHYDLVAQLHKLGCVQKEETLDEGVRIVARDIPPANMERLNEFALN